MWNWSESESVRLSVVVWLFVTPWTVALQAPLSRGSSRQVYWSGSPFLSPKDPANFQVLHLKRKMLLWLGVKEKLAWCGNRPASSRRAGSAPLLTRLPHLLCRHSSPLTFFQKWKGSCCHMFTHSAVCPVIQQRWLRVCHSPASVLGAGHTVTGEWKHGPCPQGTHHLVGEAGVNPRQRQNWGGWT